MKKSIPGPLWIATVSLALMVLGKVLSAFKVGPAVLIDAVLSGVLLVGIVLGQKWAYVLTIVFTVLGTIGGFGKGIQAGIGVLILDCLVLLPVLLCTAHFFPKPQTVEVDQSQPTDDAS